MIKNAPYKFVEFQNITVKTTVGNQVDKFFSSKTGKYEYVNTQDSLIKQKVILSKDDLLYLHRKAAELGFWNWPEKMIGDTSGKSPRYYIEYDYERKKKVIEVDAMFQDDMKLKEASLELIKTIDLVIRDAADKGQ